MQSRSRQAVWCVAGLAAALAIQVLPASAGIRDSRFTVSPDGRSVSFDVKDVPRRDVLNRLFAGRPVQLHWLNPAAGSELISGKFIGTPSKVAYQILSATDFVVIYDRSGPKPQISRFVVLGPSSGRPTTTAQAAMEPTLPTGIAPDQTRDLKLPGTPDPSATAPVLPAISPVPLSVELPLKPVVGVDAASFFKPPPPGEHGPLILPPQAGTAPPLTPPASDLQPVQR